MRQQLHQIYRLLLMNTQHIHYCGCGVCRASMCEWCRIIGAQFEGFNDDRR